MPKGTKFTGSGKLGLIFRPNFALRKLTFLCGKEGGSIGCSIKKSTNYFDVLCKTALQTGNFFWVFCSTRALSLDLGPLSFWFGSHRPAPCGCRDPDYAHEEAMSSSFI